MADAQRFRVGQRVRPKDHELIGTIVDIGPHSLHNYGPRSPNPYHEVIFEDGHLNGFWSHELELVADELQPEGGDDNG